MVLDVCLSYAFA
ncbi:hypothetical protein V9K24_003495 [Vibrio cholerae]|nr:hypothetical protein [Vibrio cholerae]